MSTRIGLISPSILLRSLNWIGIPLLVVYIVSMFIFPWVNEKGDWQHVQNVWHSWQALNVGMLAFLSSVVAFNVVRFNERKQRERNFVAARAFLPESLSELTGYFKLCAPFLKEAWKKAKDGNRKSSLKSEFPILPKEYKGIFSKCIAYAEPEVGEYLAYISMRLQVHNSRLKGLTEDFGENSTMVVGTGNVETYMYRLAELQALVNRIFDFARGSKKFDNSTLVWEDYRNAFSNLDIWPEDYDDLVGFIHRLISRNRSKNET